MKIEITSLRVVDCGPLKDVRIDFTDKETGKPLPVVLLAGANGSGKTTVLEVMFGLFQMLDPYYKQVPSAFQRFTYAFMNCLIDEIPFSFHYGGIEEFGGDSIHKENVGNFKVVESTKSFAAYVARGAFPTGTELALRTQEIIRRTRLLLSDVTFGEGSRIKNSDSMFAPAILYFPHYRAIEPVEGQEIRRETTQYSWTYKNEVVKSFAGSLSSYLIWLDYAEPEAFLSAKGFLDKLYPDMKNFGINRRALKAVIHTANGGAHDVDKLSSGEQNLLIMLLELRRRLLPGSIVLIDELENSLHPAFQHRLAQGLLQLQREIPFQLIATTHAETFVDIFGTNATRVLPTPSAVPAAEIK